jgi:ankyrin repeat protein
MNQEIALLLPEHGADAKPQDKDKRTPLHWALGGGWVGNALLLLQHGAAQLKTLKTRTYQLLYAFLQILARMSNE